MSKKPPTPIEPKLLTVKDAATVLALARNEVYELARSGQLDRRYIGKGTRSYRITMASINEYIESRPQDPKVAS